MTSSLVRSRSASRLLLALAMTTLACNASDPDAASKDDARKHVGDGKADDGTDVCEDNGWYHDDVCDLFCPLPDPDCDKDDGTDQCADNGWYDDGVCDTFCPKPDPDCGDTGGTCPNDDSCTFANDSGCDDGGLGSITDLCAPGTDLADCGFRSGDDCTGGDGDLCANDDSCKYADDGACDDGGPGSSFDVCDIGTDVSDCGSRSDDECSGDASCANSDTCKYADDGACDDGGPGSSFDVCDIGTDVSDCGFRTGSECDGDSGDACANDNSCKYASDGACDDGGPDSEFSVCTIGTDTADCGVRSGSVCDL